MCCGPWMAASWQYSLICWSIFLQTFTTPFMMAWKLEGNYTIISLFMCFFLGENCLMQELHKLWKKYPYSPATSESKNQMNMWQVVAGHFNVLLWCYSLHGNFQTCSSFVMVNPAKISTHAYPIIFGNVLNNQIVFSKLQRHF